MKAACKERQGATREAVMSHETPRPHRLLIPHVDDDDAWSPAMLITLIEDNSPFERYRCEWNKQ